MQYIDEETRDAFHDLDTDTQLILNDLEVALAEQGLFLHIEDVDNSTSLEIVVRIAEQSHRAIVQ